MYALVNCNCSVLFNSISLQLLSHVDPLPSITSLSPSPPPSAGDRRPVSVYSMTSSTSGIASLGQSQLDLASMVTPTDSNADSANTTPTPYSDVGEKSVKTPSRKKVSWSGAIKLLRRKTRYTLPLVGATSTVDFSRL